MRRPFVPPQRAVQVHGYKGFDVQWLQITGILVLIQEVSYEHIKASSKGQVGEETCAWVSLCYLLNDRNWSQLIYMHALLLIGAKNFMSFGCKEIVVTPCPEKHLQKEALSH